MVEQKCLYKVFFHRNSDTFYFSATRNHRNGKTDMSRVLLHQKADTFYFSAVRNQCNSETEMFCFEEVLLHRNYNIFYFSTTRNQCNGETETANLISSISLQQEISTIVKQKFLTFTSQEPRCLLFLCNKKSVQQCNRNVLLLRSLLHRNSNTFYFSATRNQCNGETEMFCFEEVYFIKI